MFDDASGREFRFRRFYLPGSLGRDREQQADRCGRRDAGSARLSFRTVLFEQGLETRIVPDRIPDWIELQDRDGDRLGRCSNPSSSATASPAFPRMA